MNSSPTAPSRISDPSVERLRVVDVGRWLWVVTVVVLLLGFLVLRELSGVQDAPQVEATEVLPVGGSPSVGVSPQEQGMHTLHPVTSQEGTPALGVEGSETPVSLRGPQLDETWPDFSNRVDTARQGEVVR
jgi:hypothetical protein